MMILGLSALLAMGCAGKDASETEETGAGVETGDTAPAVETDLPADGCLGEASTLDGDTCVSEAPCAWGGRSALRVASDSGSTGIAEDVPALFTRMSS